MIADPVTLLDGRHIGRVLDRGLKTGAAHQGNPFVAAPAGGIGVHQHGSGAGGSRRSGDAGQPDAADHAANQELPAGQVAHLVQMMIRPHWADVEMYPNAGPAPR